MKIIHVSKNDLLYFENIKSNGKESTLLFSDNKAFKILHPNRRKGREQIIELLHDDPIPNFVNTRELVYDEEHDSFIGYTMDYLDGYLTLMDTSYRIKYDYESRKKVCLKIIETVEEIIRRKYFYRDLHDENVLIKGSNAIFCDIDGLKLDSTSNDMYEHSITTKSDTVDIMYELLLNRNRLPDYEWGFSNPRTNPSVVFEINKEFNNDIMTKCYFNSDTDPLFKMGYSLKDFLNSMTEEKVESINELIRKV